MKHDIKIMLRGVTRERIYCIVDGAMDTIHRETRYMNTPMWCRARMNIVYGRWRWRDFFYSFSEVSILSVHSLNSFSSISDTSDNVSSNSSISNSLIFG